MFSGLVYDTDEGGNACWASREVSVTANISMDIPSQIPYFMMTSLTSAEMRFFRKTVGSSLSDRRRRESKTEELKIRSTVHTALCNKLAAA